MLTACFCNLHVRFSMLLVSNLCTLNIPDAWRVHRVFCICIDMFSKCSACVPCNHCCSLGEIWCSSWVWRVRQVFCDCTDMFSRSCFVCSCWYWCSTGNTGALPMPYASDLCSVTAQTCSPNVLLGAASRHFHSHENTSVRCVSHAFRHVCCNCTDMFSKSFLRAHVGTDVQQGIPVLIPCLTRLTCVLWLHRRVLRMFCWVLLSDTFVYMRILVFNVCLMRSVTCSVTAQTCSPRVSFESSFWYWC